MIYEVDNRYPEIAPLYEKVRGGKHHSPLSGRTQEVLAKRRAIRINHLKQSFCVTATAVLAVLTLLFVSPGKGSRSIDPEPVVTFPVLSVVSAACDEEDPSLLRYSYQVELNSAEQISVTAQAVSEDGTPLGTDGPALHTESGVSELRTMSLNRTDLPWVNLELSGEYLMDGQSFTLHDTVQVPLPQPPVVPDTEPVPTETEPTEPPPTETEPTETDPTETEPTEPEPTQPEPTQPEPTQPEPTQPEPTQPTPPTPVFTAPTLSITAASLDETNVTPLSYSYRVSLNSAQSLSVRAVVSSNNGATLGTDGAYSHTEAGSFSRSCSLRFAARPSSVTLTLTGTYTENGTAKTLTVSRTLTVPEEPFTAPELTITAAELDETNLTPLSYSYQVKLNSADVISVRAVLTSDSGGTLNNEGPYLHSASESASHSMRFTWDTRPRSVTLTLTGTYLENGSTKTVTATQTLTVPEEPFEAPTLDILDVNLDATDYSPLSYVYEVTLNSAERLSVAAAITDESGNLLGSGGPYVHTASGTDSQDNNVSWPMSAWPTSMTLTLTGTYTEKGVEKTITAARTIPVPEKPFEAPTLTITAASLDETDLSPLSYTYQVTLNSAESLSVRAAVTNESGGSLGGAGPYDHTASESSSRVCPLSWTVWPETVTLTLTGTYTEEGVEKTVTAARSIPVPEKPFTAPELTITAASLDETDLSPLSYTYQVTLNSAESLSVRAAVTNESGGSLGGAGPYDHTASESSSRVCPLSWTVWPETVTLTLTGTYMEDGVEKTVTAARSIPVPEKPFEAPTLDILDVNLDATDYSPLSYVYEVTLNSAERLSVAAAITDESGNLLGSGGPYVHTASGTDSQDNNVSWPMDAWPTTMTLTLTGTYMEDGVEKTVTAARTIPVPEKPFEAPTLTITAASLNETNVSPLSYTYQVTLNSAESLSVRAVLTSDSGNTLNNEGPYVHSASGSTSRSMRFTWTTRPESVTLTLTGTYTEDGVEKTVTAAQTLTVPPESFEAPTIAIETGLVLFPDYLIQYKYSVTLNDAEELSVKAAFRYEEEDTDGNLVPVELAEDGPYVHSASETTELLSVTADEYPSELPAKMTLTGTYKDRSGVEHEISVEQELELFGAPMVWITSAQRDGMNNDLVVYSAEIYLNSADQLTVNTSVGTESTVITTDGPVTFTADEILTDRTILADDSGSLDLILTLTGEYELEGETRTVSDSLDVEDASAFEEPELSIDSVERGGATENGVVYSFTAGMNSASLLKVRAEFYDADDNKIHETEPVEITDGGAFGPYSVDTGSPATRMRLVGEYEHLGSSYYVYDDAELPAVFTPPTLSVDSARGIPSAGTAFYSYSVNLNSASGLIVEASFFYETIVDGIPVTTTLGTDGPRIHSASGSTERIQVDLSAFDPDDAVKLTLTGRYEDEDGTMQEIQVTQPLEIFTAPTVRILSAERNTANPNQLIYDAEIQLNSADSLQLSVDAASAGVSVASDGPFTFTADASLRNQTLLAPDTAAQELTLTLTGSYTLDGESLQVSDSAVIAAVSSFEPPTLAIETARLDPSDYLGVYSYTVTLNDAAQMEVSASFSCVEENDDGSVTTSQVGTDGPYTHSDSGTTGKHEVMLDEFPAELTVQLTLTGTYEDGAGVEQEITVTKVLEVFIQPSITITSAKRDGLDVELIVYSAEIKLNSADSLTVRASADGAGVNYGADGPFHFTADATLTDQTLQADASEGVALTLTLTGSYEQDGETQEIRVSATVESPDPFDAPELEIWEADRLENPNFIRYTYYAAMNSVSLMNVHAEFFYDDTKLTETDPVEVSADGSYGPFTADIGEIATVLRIVGEFQHLGQTYSVSDEIHIPEPTGGFEEPLIDYLEAEVPAFDDWDSVQINFNCDVFIGDAEELILSYAVASNTGDAVGEGTGPTFTEDGRQIDSLPLTLTGNETSVTLTVTGKYERDGELYSVSSSTDVILSMTPEEFDASVEYYAESDTEFVLWLYAHYTTRENDPHKDAYDFAVDTFTLDWYDGSGNRIQRDDLTSEAAGTLSVDYYSGIYYLESQTTTAPVAGASSIRVYLTVKDGTTGKVYHYTSDDMPLE